MTRDLRSFDTQGEDYGYEDTAPLPVLPAHPEDDLERTQTMPVVVLIKRRDEAFRLMVWHGILDFYKRVWL